MSTFFITGCSTGIGRSLAWAAARAGHRVVATARQPNSLADLAGAFPKTVITAPLDVTHEASVADAAALALAAFGEVDVVVCNAGVGYFATIEESEPARVAEMMDINFWGVTRTVHAFLPHLRERRSGHVIAVSSIAGIRGSAGLGYYCASKFAVSGFMEALAAEVAHLGIRATVVEPGPVRSQWIPSGGKVRAIHPDYADVMAPFWARIDSLPGHQPGDPDALAEAMLALVEADAPPVHFIAGEHALTQTRAKLERMAAEVAAWEELTRQVDRA